MPKEGCRKAPYSSACIFVRMYLGVVMVSAVRCFSSRATKVPQWNGDGHDDPYHQRARDEKGQRMIKTTEDKKDAWQQYRDALQKITAQEKGDHIKTLASHWTKYYTVESTMNPDRESPGSLPFLPLINEDAVKKINKESTKILQRIHATLAKICTDANSKRVSDRPCGKMDLDDIKSFLDDMRAASDLRAKALRFAEVRDAFVRECGKGKRYLGLILVEHSELDEYNEEQKHFEFIYELLWKIEADPSKWNGFGKPVEGALLNELEGNFMYTLADEGGQTGQKHFDGYHIAMMLRIRRLEQAVKGAQEQNSPSRQFHPLAD
jgi:hypothetical protein